MQSGIPIIYSKILLDILSEMGFHPSAILRGTGIAVSDIVDPDFKLTLDEQDTVYGNAINVSKVEGLGLLHGQRILPTHLGIMGYAIQTSSNLKQAIRLIVSYSEIVGSLMDFHFETDGETGTLAATNVSARGEVRQHVVEEHLASIDRILKTITGNKFRAAKVRLDYPTPSWASRYRDVFECPVEFECPAIEYQFKTRLLDLDVVFADPATAKACERKCEAIIGRMSRAGSFVDQIRRIVLMLPCESRNLTSVAEEMNTSARSVRRKLAEEQTTFQQLLDEIRLELATNYLKNTDLTLEDIAPLLGFSESSSFRHAFKKWTGLPPSALREIQASGSVSERPNQGASANILASRL